MNKVHREITKKFTFEQLHTGWQFIDPETESKYYLIWKSNKVYLILIELLEHADAITY